MECKGKWNFYDSQADEVLIETLWNVKTADGRTERWGIAGFNRNIVECKGH